MIKHKINSDNEPHLVCEVIDLNCHHRWIAVYPEKTLLKELECPNCGTVGHVIKTGQDLEDDGYDFAVQVLNYRS